MADEREVRPRVGTLSCPHGRGELSVGFVLVPDVDGVWCPVDSEVQPSQRCTMFLFGPGRGRCWAEATARVTMSCVHEHFETDLLCEFCLSGARASGAFCSPCSDVDGHECVVSVVRTEPLEPLAVTESSP